MKTSPGNGGEAVYFTSLSKNLIPLQLFYPSYKFETKIKILSPQKDIPKINSKEYDINKINIMPLLTTIATTITTIVIISHVQHLHLLQELESFLADSSAVTAPMLLKKNESIFLTNSRKMLLKIIWAV